MDVSDASQVPLVDTVSGRNRIFPVLTAAQIARVASHGRRRQTTSGQVLVDVGDKEVPFFVVVTGAVHVLQLSHSVEALIVSQGPGTFTGEVSLISGRPAM